MATNIFSTVNTDFIGNLVLDQYVQALAPLRAFTLSATTETSFRGDTVKVLSVGTGSTALDYTTDYSMQAAGATGIDVSLNKQKYTSLELKDSEWRNSGILEVEHFARSRGNALANSVLTDVMSFVSSSFYTETRTVSKSVAFSGSAVVDLSAYADGLKWDAFGRSMLLTPTQHSYLRKDNVIAQTYSFGTDDVIRRGEIPSVDTWQSIYKTPVVPNGSVGVCALPSAVVFASRVVAPPEGHSYSDVKVLADESTGLSITQLNWHNPDVGARRIVWTVNYGYAVGNSKGAFLLI